MIRVTVPGVFPRRGFRVNTLSLEKHHADVDVPRTRRDNALPESAKIVLVEAREVKLRLSVKSQTRSHSDVRRGSDSEVIGAPGDPVGLFPRPQPDEVQAMGFESGEIPVEVEPRERLHAGDVL